ncbi:MAG: SPFH domain-containing protein [Deltaproteobacteria bacterium]|jgi:membrane protease subunit (stomatin/prohibitin family)|nr:SPFH domain-containing protein [Deltaproteobacteria bacterium]
MAIIDLVKYSGPASVLAWKYPNSELSTWTRLIVNESQEAVFFKGGQALDTLGPGTHTLESKNLPVLTELLKLPFGGKSPFSAEVWFVNRAHSLDIKWGTPTPIQLQDPKFGIMVPVRSFGQFGIQVDDSRKFLFKLVGTTPVFDQETVTKYFRGIYLTKAKDTIATYLVKKKLSILEVSAYLDELSGHILERIQPTMAEYGIKLLSFYVNDVSVPEDDPGVAKLKAALAKKAEMDIIGYSYQQERTFDTLEGAASNPGGQSTVMGAGIGLGMGVEVGRTLTAQMGAVTGQAGLGPAAAATPAVSCPKCRAQVPQGQKFCQECGAAMANPVQKVIKCDKCGAVISPKAKFCPECGDPYNPCPECGADLPEGAAKCPSCGAVLPPPCPKCGEHLAPGAKFCPSCGAALRKKCSKCQTEMPLTAKFCTDCGQPV